MELSPTELRHRIQGLTRAERRQQARYAWNHLELWNDPEYAHLSRQEARKQSWQDYWPMWTSGYQWESKVPPTSSEVPQKGFLGRLKDRLLGA